MLHVFYGNLVKVVETFLPSKFPCTESYFSFTEQDDDIFLLHVLLSQALRSIFLLFILNCASVVQSL